MLRLLLAAEADFKPNASVAGDRLKARYDAGVRNVPAHLHRRNHPGAHRSPPDMAGHAPRRSGELPAGVAAPQLRACSLAAVSPRPSDHPVRLVVRGGPRLDGQLVWHRAAAAACRSSWGA